MLAEGGGGIRTRGRVIDPPKVLPAFMKGGQGPVTITKGNHLRGCIGTIESKGNIAERYRQRHRAAMEIVPPTVGNYRT